MRLHLENEKESVMPHQATVAATPHYVLLEGQSRVGPQIARGTTDGECLPIYGFSNKSRYDLFCQNSPAKLTPFPLVEAFLQNQIGMPGDCLRLIVLDASGPDDARVHAATIAVVLEAHLAKAQQLPTGYQMEFDSMADSYQVHELPV